MATILNRVEAGLVVRVAEDDERLFDMLPQVDEYIKRATGVDWGSIDPIPVAAKSAARMLLVKWYEDPGSLGGGEATLGFGLRAALMQLKAEALTYATFEGIDGGGFIPVPQAHLGDEVERVTGILGVSGDQSASFATYVEFEGMIEQVSTEDLSEMWFRVKLKPLEEQ